MNYDLHRDIYTIRYFYPQESPEKILKEIRKFIKDNPYVDIQNINIDHNYQRDENSTLTHGWLAHVSYSGSTNEENENA